MDEFSNLQRRMFKHIIDGQIKKFFRHIKSNSDLEDELQQSDYNLKSITSIASKYGYSFSQIQLKEYLEETLDILLSPEENSRRQACMEAKPLLPTFNKIEKKHLAPRVNYHSYFDNFVLCRKSILEGNVSVISFFPSISKLKSVISNDIKKILCVDNLSYAHLQITHEELIRRAPLAFETLKNNNQITSIMNNIISELGLDSRHVLWQWPTFRIFFPEKFGSLGINSGSTSFLLDPHRDTWYGAPQHQINVWGPIEPIAKNQTLNILADYHQIPVQNSSKTVDVWYQYLGLSLIPKIQTEVSTSNVLAPPLNSGDAMLFCGHALHSSSKEQITKTRVSFEFRLVHQDDKNADYKPENIDYFGNGTLFRNWYNHHGVEINLYSGEPFEKSSG